MILINKNLFVIVFVVVFLVLFTSIIYTYKRETFFVAYNNSNVPINKIETLDESDVIYLNTILNEYNTSGFPDTSQMTKSSDRQGTTQMTKSSDRQGKSPSPLSNKVKDLISERVITTLRILFSKGTKYRGDKLILKRIKTEKSETEPFYDLYWKVINNDIHCVFKMDIMNIEKGWARTFKIYLVVTMQDIIIKTISLEEFSYLSLEEVNENENQSDSTYYKIENTLHLMDPYLTSGKEMKITDSMRQNFNNVLKKKYLT